MVTRTIIDPIAPSLSLAKFKQHLRITSEDLDAELQDKLYAAVRSAEATIDQVIAPSIFRDNVRYRSSYRLKGPVIEVLEVLCDDFPVEGWKVRNGVLQMPSGVSGEELTVVWKAGWEDIPYDVAAAVFLKGARLFNNPGDSVDTLTTVSDNLLRPYRTWGEYDDED